MACSAQGVTECPRGVTEHPLSLWSLDPLPGTPVWAVVARGIGEGCSTHLPSGAPTTNQEHPPPFSPFLPPGSLELPQKPEWRYEEGINGVFLSGDIQMTDSKLQVTSGGLYLLYGQFALTCTAPTCPPGTITLKIFRASSPHPLLTIPLALSDHRRSEPTPSGLAQAIGQLQAGDVLSLVLEGDMKGDGWQLAQDQREGNFVGLLRIAGG